MSYNPLQNAEENDTDLVSELGTMSYNQLRNDDSLSELVREISDFNKTGKYLLKYKNDFDNYLVWSSKAMEISPRSYYRFLEKYNDEFCDEIKAYNEPFLTEIRNKKRSLDYCINRRWLEEE